MSAPTTGKNSSVVAVAPPPEPISLDSDFVVILAALLCALICVVGLVAVARCAWLRRYTSGAAANRSRQQASANKGLRKKILRSLPKMVFNGEVNVNGKLVDCAICLTEFMEGDEIRILPQCGHGFHVGCIDTWLGSHSSCPSCRQILVVTRCKKCGGVPETSSTTSSVSAAATSCSSSSRAAHNNHIEAELKAREDMHVNRFLP